MQQNTVVTPNQTMLERALWKSMEPFAHVHINTAVHPDDQMFTWSARHHNSADIALSQYYTVALQQLMTVHQLMTWRFGEVSNVGAMLDFASGFGRMVRLLTVSLPASRIWVSDIQADAVAFQEEQFGVHGIVSTEAPEQFDPGRAFDFIFVASLFSHLPEKSFARWLATLHGLLSSNGVLCFSVHDEVLMNSPHEMPDSGIYYARGSEIDALDAEQYGTTHVTEAYVRRAIAEATGDSRYIRIKRALAYQQDLYVVVKGSETPFAPLRFQYGPWGWLDRAQVVAPGRMSLYGWAADVDPDQRIDTIEVRLDGKIVQVCMPSVLRGDVWDHFGESSFGISYFDGTSSVGVPYDSATFAASGWDCSFMYEPSNPQQFLEVTAISSHGQRCPLYMGGVEAVLH